jgi:hypothetical protein
LNNRTHNDSTDAQQILSALNEIQSDPKLQAEAASNPEGLLDRLHLSGVARHAVAFSFTALVAGTTVLAGGVSADAYWQ